jgi:hypothetical protein
MLDNVVTLPYTSTTTWDFNENRVVWVQVEDSAGNISEPYPAYAPDMSEFDWVVNIYLPMIFK